MAITKSEYCLALPNASERPLQVAPVQRVIDGPRDLALPGYPIGRIFPPRAGREEVDPVRPQVAHGARIVVTVPVLQQFALDLAQCLYLPPGQDDLLGVMQHVEPRLPA